MCMTLLLSEATSRALTSGTCRLEWSNFTECVVTYLVTRGGSKAKFGGVISTAVLSYIDVNPETRLSIYAPNLCVGLMVMMLNGWLLVTLQGETAQKRSTPFVKLFTSLTATHCLHGAISVYIMTSLIASALSPNPLYRNKSVECILTNSCLFTLLLSSLIHTVLLAIDRVHQAVNTVQYRAFWSSSYKSILVTLCAWIISFVIGFLPLFGWRTNFRYCIFFYLYEKIYLTILTAIFVLCLLIIAASHSYVLLTVRKPNGLTLNMKSSRSRKRLETRYTNAAAVLAVISTILWTPLYLHLVLACPDCAARSDNDYILISVFILALSNGLISPMIYALMVKRIHCESVCKQWGIFNVKRRSGTFELRSNTVVVNNINNAIPVVIRKPIPSRRQSMDTRWTSNGPPIRHSIVESTSFPNGDILY
ncbi:hypothetical protein CHUAL_001816 [Chamberlinius hualienensis]